MSTALKIHAHYSKLFEAFAMLPLDDIRLALFEQACDLWAESPWNEFGIFLERIESYLQQSELTPERRKKIEGFLIKQKPNYERGIWLVETRPRVIESDEHDLQRRLSDTVNGRIYAELESVRRGDDPAALAEHFTKVKIEVERRLGILAAQRAGQKQSVLLQAADTNEVREFGPEHAERLLAYPGTIWEKAPLGSVVIEPIPVLPVGSAPAGQQGCSCQRTSDAERVEDLSADCSIVAMLNDPLATAHVRAEMREIKELKLSEQYQQYCSERLEHHASLAAQLANEMNRPGGWNHAKMGAKFYNKAVAKLYRNELLPPSAQKEPASKIKAKSPLSDILRYFPALAPTLGNQPTDESALADLALWLMHWFERNEKFSDTPRYTLLGKMQQQQRAATGRVKFLNACERLRKALTPFLATELSARQLLNTMFTTDCWQGARDAVNWWAGWIREQREITPPVRTLADAYLEALQRIPLAVEWVNSSPRYIVQARLDSTGFAADIRALREGFETTIRTLQPVALRTLRTQFGKLLKVDQERIKRCRESFERQEYSLEFLAEDFDALRFEVADNPDGLTQWQWVGPTFWADINVLVQYKQEAARSAFEVLNDALEAPSAQQSTASNNTPIPANYWLAEWRHFFPGDASRFSLAMQAVLMIY